MRSSDDKPGPSPSCPVVVADPRFGPGALIQWLRHRWPFGAREKAGADLPALPGARMEGRCVAVKLDARLLSGSRASRAAVRRLRSPRVLHFATHTHVTAGRDYGAGCREAAMLRQGLALSGAAVSGTDGILTAADIACMDLAGTELAVLSSCASGLGELISGDGMVGLRRGFALAGTRALLISLWPVDDRATTLLMMRFYEEWVDRDQSIERSLRNAQRWLRSLSVADAAAVWRELDSNGELDCPMAPSPDHKPYADPYFWGGFVVNRYALPRVKSTHTPMEVTKPRPVC